MQPKFGSGTHSRAQPNYDLNKVAREPWIDCDICSFSIPVSESVKHYKKGKLVCTQCADELTHDDEMTSVQKDRQERIAPTPQKVRS